MTSQILPWPTGRWLTAVRERRGLSVASLARSLGQHPNTVHAIERQDLVLPPGWAEPLRALGLPVPEPLFERPYGSAELRAELEAKPHLGLTPYWLSRKLSLAEDTVHAVLVGEAPVPPSWLPKLAELGLEGLPEVVGKRPSCIRVSAETMRSFAKEEPPTFLLRWTQEQGLLLRVSGPLLEALPGALRDLITALHSSGLETPWGTRSSPCAKDEGHGAQ
ncbi:MAG: helix-turn-helix transcriptional regulator [Polyangia bacterium]